MAETLGRTVEEIENEMSVTEFFEWAAFFDYKAKEQKKAVDKAKAEAKRGRRR